MQATFHLTMPLLEERLPLKEFKLWMKYPEAIDLQRYLRQGTAVGNISLTSF